MIHIYNRILLCHKKEWSNAICNNMDGPKDYHTTKTNMISLMCEIYIKNDTNELIYKRGTDLQIWKTNLWVSVRGRDKLGAWDEHTNTNIYKIGNQQGPTA